MQLIIFAQGAGHRTGLQPGMKLSLILAFAKLNCHQFTPPEADKPFQTLPDT